MREEWEIDQERIVKDWDEEEEIDGKEIDGNDGRREGRDEENIGKG